MSRLSLGVALGMALVLAARATSVEFPVTPKSLDQGRYLFSVSSHSTSGEVVFEVTVTAGTNSIPSDASAGVYRVASEAGARSMGPVNPQPQVAIHKDEHAWKAVFVVPEELRKNPDICFVFAVVAHATLDGKSVPMPSMDLYVLKLRDFINPPDLVPDGLDVQAGANPRAGLVLSGNMLYGTASDHAGALGGAWGTVFKVSTDGQRFAVLHSFSPLTYPHPTNSDGAAPRAGLVLSGRTLYGTASEGGLGGGGTVFKINTDGTGFTVLHSFSAQQSTRSGNYEGARPLARLTLSGHTLYGTTQRGGNNEGTVFKLNTDGTGFTTLHSFTPLSQRDLTNWDGAFPEAELVVSGEAIYGTAWSGGSGKAGTVFKLKTDGTGFSVLHSFKVLNGSSNWNDHGGPCNADGAYPEAGLVLAGSTLYGTAHTGGRAGNGTVFKLSTDGRGFTVLHSFTAHGNSYPANLNHDGEDPKGLLLSGNTLYGIASASGSGGWGTLFRLKANGTGFEVLRNFGGTDGSSPQGTLLLSGKMLYGTANFGGGRGGGTVYRLETNGTGFTVLHRFTKEPLPGALTD